MKKSMPNQPTNVDFVIQKTICRDAISAGEGSAFRWYRVFLMVALLVNIIFCRIPNAHADLRNGLVGWWKFDEVSGNAIDSSGQSNTGTPNGTTIASNCKKRGCRQFNGTSDYINLGTILPSTQSTMSISAWIKWDGGGSGLMRVIGRKNNAQINWAYGLVVNTAGSITFERARNTLAVGDNSITSSETLVANQWFHIVCVQQSDTALSIFVNGTRTDKVVTTGTWTPDAGESLYIGRFSSSITQYFSGFMDDVRIYNRALTAQEVYDLYIPGIVLRNGVVRNGRINQ